MPGSLTVQTVARVGENLHLLVIYAIGILTIFKYRANNRTAFNAISIGLALLIGALFVSGFRSAWNDLHNFANAYNAKDFSQTMPYILSGGIAFAANIAAWGFLLFGIAKALKSPSCPPRA